MPNLIHFRLKPKPVKSFLNWRRLVFGLMLFGLWISGVIWLLLPSGSNFVDPYQSLRVFLMKLHGALALIFLPALGTLFEHVRQGLQKKQRRASGLSLLGIFALLIMSAWGLYYLGDEGWRKLASVVHSAFGVLVVVIIALHGWILSMKRRTELNSAQQAELKARERAPRRLAGA